VIVERATEHPASLMAELFDLGKRRVYRRSARAIPFLRKQGHQFVKLLLRLR